MNSSILGIERQGPFERGDRRGPLRGRVRGTRSLSPEREAQVVVSLGQRWRGGDDLTEQGLRAFQPVRPRTRECQPVARANQRGSKSQRPGKAGNGITRAVEAIEREPEMKVCIRESGSQTDGVPKCEGGGVELPTVSQRHA